MTREKDRPEHVMEFMTLNESVKAVRTATELSPVQVALIGYLGILNPGATPSQISAEYDLPSDHTAKMLKTLVVSGYIWPIEDDKDRRMKHYWNTEKGSEVASAYLKQRGHDIAATELPHVKVRKPQVRGPKG